MMARKNQRNRRADAEYVDNTEDGEGQDPIPPTERPTYNLGAVVQRTGLKPDTLRAWERRYGLPMPERTPGGHRLYSEADVQCLFWLIARQEEGMNISQAVKLWRALETEGRLPATQEETPSAIAPPIQKTSRSLSGGVIEDLRLLAQAFALYPTEIVCTEVLQKGLSQIGVDWYQGKVTVQQEHFASALAMRRLETLLAAAPEPNRSGRIVVACPPHENHTFGPLLITVLLRRRGWNVLYLGANMPQEELDETLRVTHPDLVVLAAQQLSTAAALMEMAYILIEQEVRIGYGGQIFNMIPDLRSRIPGHFLGADLAAAPFQIERLMVRPPLPAPVQPVSQVYQRALVHFRERQAKIEAYIWQTMSDYGLSQHHLSTANHSFGRDLTAALALGNLDYLGTDLDWISGLLSYRQIAPDALIRYMRAYHEGAQRFLEKPGQIIVEWLANLLNRYDLDVQDTPEEDLPA